MTEEVQNEVEVNPVNPLSNMIDYITHGEFTKANEIFNDVLADRVSDALEQEKVAIAQGIYSSEEETDEEDYEEYDGEDYEEALDEIETDEDED